jgi:hypothetical protein
MIRFDAAFKCVINFFKRFDHSLHGFNGLPGAQQEGGYHVVNPLQRFLSWSAIIGGIMKRIKTEYRKAGRLRIEP